MTSAPPILVVAHPGHELKLFNWMERERPLVVILSDGSGGANGSRLPYSASVIGAAGATLLEDSGRISDRQWYAAMLAGDRAPFAEAVDRIAAAATQRQAPLIVSDAADAYNPLHDLCQAIAGAVIERLSRHANSPGFLVSPATPRAIGNESVAWQLGDEAAQRKRLVLSDYAPLAPEIAQVLAEEPDTLRTERLLVPAFDWPDDFTPEWEAFGRKRVAEGRFAAPITYRDHVLPIARSLLARGQG